MKQILVAAVGLMAAAGTVAAQDVLPGGFAQWTPARTEKLACTAIERLAGSDAAALREYGCRAVERREYRRDGNALTITGYRMQDSTGAYGAFFFRRASEMKDSSVSDLAAAREGKILAVAGDVLLEIEGQGLERFETDLQALAADIKARFRAAPFPTLANYLPDQGRVPNSEQFVLGGKALERFAPLSTADWVGFETGAEAQLATYRLREQEVKLLLVQYPTPQIASARLEGLRRWFNVNGDEEVVSGRPVVFARRTSSLVAIVPESTSRETAESLFDAVRYETQITVNEPSFKATDPTWGEMIVGIFYGTGIFLLIAVSGGLLFGGVRLVVKRLLPGKVFDRDTSVEILQLGLGSKPIEGKDFYTSGPSSGR
jgi:hypothetical protein